MLLPYLYDPVNEREQDESKADEEEDFEHYSPFHKLTR